MSAAKKTPIFILQTLLLLTGWTLAAVLGWRWWEQDAEPPPVPAPVLAQSTPPVPEGKVERIFREWAVEPQRDGALVGFCLLDESGAPLFASRRSSRPAPR